MSASVAGLVQKFGFKASPPSSAGISSESRKARSAENSEGNAGVLIGAASLYVFVVGSLLWSAPAWMVVLAPLVQAGVAESLYCRFGGDEHRNASAR